VEESSILCLIITVIFLLVVRRVKSAITHHFIYTARALIERCFVLSKDKPNDEKVGTSRSLSVIDASFGEEKCDILSRFTPIFYDGGVMG